VLLVPRHQPAQGLRVSEGSKWPVNGADDCAQEDLPGRASQPVAAFGAALASYVENALATLSLTID
jgi:hypothetical protein